MVELTVAKLVDKKADYSAVESAVLLVITSVERMVVLMVDMLV